MWPRKRVGLVALILAVAIPLFLLTIRLMGQQPDLPRLKPGEEQERLGGRNTADEISQIVRDQTGAKRVDSIVLANIAVVGIDRGGGNTGGNTGGNRSEGTRSDTEGPNASDTYVLKQATQADIMSRYPFLVRIYSTDDPDTVDQISTLARDFRHQVPLDKRIDIVAQVVKTVSRPAAGGVGPTVR